MKTRPLLLSFLSSAVLCGAPAIMLAADPVTKPAPATDAAAPAEQEPAAVDPQALTILKRAVDLLAGAGQFSVTAEIWEDVLLENGTTAQTAKTADIKLRRPDRLQVDVKTTKPKRSFFYDGKTLTVVDRQKNYFGATPVPRRGKRSSQGFAADLPTCPARAPNTRSARSSGSSSPAPASAMCAGSRRGCACTT